MCINTGGEKVFPEEVEEALKLHPAVADAVVVGVPDDRFGERVTALVGVASWHGSARSRRSHRCGQRASGRYKAPRRVSIIESINRAANGKVDYRRLREHAMALTKGTITELTNQPLALCDV